MEQNNYLINLGNAVINERRKKDMSQVDFYKFLFPGTDKEDENIKKKMNKIEKGKQKSIDFDFLKTLCEKCNLSVDYLFGKETNYRNYDSKFVCKYTGLTEKTIAQLHNWAIEKNYDVDVSILKEGYEYNNYNEEEIDKKFDDAHKKSEATQMLKIVECIFDEDNTKKGKNKKKHSSSSILYSIYSMCMTEPVAIVGQSYNSKGAGEETTAIKADYYVALQNKNGMTSLCMPRDIFLQFSKNNLNRQIDRMIEQITMDE